MVDVGCNTVGNLFIFLILIYPGLLLDLSGITADLILSEKGLPLIS